MAAWGSRRLSLRLGDYRRVLLAAFSHLEHPVALVTITQPADYDNRSAAARWAKLDRRVKGRLRREGLRVVPLARIAQRQRRGADHLHIPMRSAPGDRAAVVRYVQLLRELGPDAGFGLVDDPYFARHPKGRDGRPNRALPKRDLVFQDPNIAARYLCGYLTDSDQLSAMVSAGDHSFRALWVSPELTRLSGVTCRRLRRVRHAYFVCKALSQHSRPTPPVWWGDIKERTAILSLLRPAALSAT